MMAVYGRLSFSDNKPEKHKNLPFNLDFPKMDIPYYQCEKCKASGEFTELAYQRVIINEKWYYFKGGKWNFLKNEIFNPSKRREIYNILDK